MRFRRAALLVSVLAALGGGPSACSSAGEWLEHLGELARTAERFDHASCDEMGAALRAYIEDNEQRLIEAEDDFRSAFYLNKASRVSAEMKMSVAMARFRKAIEPCSWNRNVRQAAAALAGIDHSGELHSLGDELLIE